MQNKRTLKQGSSKARNKKFNNKKKPLKKHNGTKVLLGPV